MKGPLFSHVEKTKKLMEEKGIDVMIAASAESLLYVTGVYMDFPFVHRFATATIHPSCNFYPMNFAIILKEKPEKPILVSSMAEIMREKTWIEDVRGFTQVSRADRPEKIFALADLLEEEGLTESSIGVENKSISLYAFELLKEGLPKASFKDAEEIFQELRTIKTKDEVEKIRRATKITEKALRSAMNLIKEGVSEREIAGEIRAVIGRETIARVSHASVAARPHLGAAFLSSEYRVKKEDIVRMDAGAVYEGYISDVTRSVSVGEPSDIAKKVHRTLIDAEEKTLSAIKPGVRLADIFRVCQNTVRASGFPQFAPSFLGHSLGIEVEETWLFITPDNNRLLEPGMVFTIEIIFPLPGVVIMTLEDVIHITEDGYEKLSTIGRELTVHV